MHMVMQGGLMVMWRDKTSATSRNHPRHEHGAMPFWGILTVRFVIRAVGRGGVLGGAAPPQDWQISHIRKIGRSIGRLFGNKKICVYISHE